MRHQPDLAPQRRCHDDPDGSLIHDLSSALAALAFCAAVTFVLAIAFLPVPA